MEILRNRIEILWCLTGNPAPREGANRRGEMQPWAGQPLAAGADDPP